jgi:hypothetical protein
MMEMHRDKVIQCCQSTGDYRSHWSQYVWVMHVQDQANAGPKRALHQNTSSEAAHEKRTKTPTTLSR